MPSSVQHGGDERGAAAGARQLHQVVPSAHAAAGDERETRESGVDLRDEIGQLAADFAREYRAILDRHGGTPRPRPDVPAALQYATEQEKEAWRAMVERAPDLQEEQ